MTKSAIVIDFDGALLKSRPFDIAHKEWFGVMAELIKDYSINELAFKPDYYLHVDEIMKKYLGDVDKETRSVFARNIYAMEVLEAMKKWDLVDDFAEYLRKIKNKYLIVLITTTPSMAVKGILEKASCTGLFDIIIGSPMERQPSKKELFEEFIKKYGKPLFYIGKGDKDMQTCKDLGIKTISVSWVAKGEFTGNFEANNIEELNRILERFRIE